MIVVVPICGFESAREREWVGDCWIFLSLFLFNKRNKDQKSQREAQLICACAQCVLLRTTHASLAIVVRKYHGNYYLSCLLFFILYLISIFSLLSFSLSFLFFSLLFLFLFSLSFSLFRFHLYFLIV